MDGDSLQMGNWDWVLSSNLFFPFFIKLGFCSDSFEPGTGMVKCRTFQPTKIETQKLYIKDIQCGKTFTSFITNKNEVKCLIKNKINKALVCGVNDLNQLGIEQPENIDHVFNKHDIFNNRCFDVIYPTKIECFLNMKVIKIACGESHCLAVRLNYKL